MFPYQDEDSTSSASTNSYSLPKLSYIYWKQYYMKAGTKEYYAQYYQQNKEKHDDRVKKYKQDSEKQQQYQLEYSRKKYYENKKQIDINSLREEWRQQSTRKNKKRRLFIDEYKSKCSCRKCNDSRPYVLDFHHMDPTQKSFELGNASKKSIKDIKTELEKCITLCRNCHSEFHYLEKEQKITIEEYLTL
jgi:hypothetical protein